jgi:catechol 2,3-dioxygenase-like lactoylglutathione lyase family enzyme
MSKEGEEEMITGVHHFSLSVMNMDRTIDFYSTVLGFKLQSRGWNSGDNLGEALFGTKWGVDQREADLELAVMTIGTASVEFIEYKNPEARPYHRNPSMAGSAHIALKVENMEETRRAIEKASVEFHSPIQTFIEEGKIEWKWCYFRDPDGICVELVQQRQL